MDSPDILNCWGLIWFFCIVTQMVFSLGWVVKDIQGVCSSDKQRSYKTTSIKSILTTWVVFSTIGLFLLAGLYHTTKIGKDKYDLWKIRRK